MGLLVRPTVLIALVSFALILTFQNCGIGFESQKETVPSKKIILSGTELPKNFISIKHETLVATPPVPTMLNDRPDTASLIIDMLTQPVTVSIEVHNFDLNSTGGVVESNCSMTLRLTGEAEQKFFGALMLIRYDSFDGGSSSGKSPVLSSRVSDFIYNDNPSLVEDPESHKALHSGVAYGSYTGFAHGKSEFLDALKFFLEGQDLSACPNNYRDLYRDF